MTKQAALIGAFERALGEIQARVCISGPIAVAYSGGLDSSVLLNLAQRYAAQHAVSLFAFHIHHGISPNADCWLSHCENECRRLGLPFDFLRITLLQREERGMEEAARLARYTALGDLCRKHGVALLLTAHHLDDQAETVLLQLLRGSGVAGLAGMEAVNRAEALLGSRDLMMARPLLNASREELESYAHEIGVAYVEDESNVDTRYARNALRHEVMPALSAFFPGAAERIARTAQHAQSAQRLLNELAAQDLAQCMEGECLNLVRLGMLDDDRIDNVLRYWFASRGVRMPATAWLVELREQLFHAKGDAQICVTHADCHVRRHRDRIYLVPRRDDELLVPAPVTFRWNGEAAIAFPAFSGVLHFDVAEEGVAESWLQEQELTLRPRSGGERLKPAFNRPTRSLKHHYQELGIPAWERERLPVLMRQNALLFAAGIGMNYKNFSTSSQIRIRCRWESNDA